MAKKILAISGVETAGQTHVIGWLMIAGLAGLIFWATLRPARKKAG